MTRPVTVTVRVPVEVTLVCVVRVTPGRRGTREDPPEPDEHEVVSSSLELDCGEVVRDNEDAIYEAASEAVARGEG